MKNKTIVKIFTVAMIVTILVSIASMVYANDIGQFAQPGKATNTVTGIQSTSSVIFSVVQAVGIAVAVIMIVILAIKYISAAPGDKADIKKSAIVYVVGAVLLFAAAGILQIIKTFGESVGTEANTGG